MEKGYGLRAGWRRHTPEVRNVRQANKASTSHRTPRAFLFATILLAMPLAGCAGGPGQDTIVQAGSSTVLPVAEAWASELAQQGIQVVVSGGGSGAGASKLCAGEVDIGDMSRELKESEIARCEANGIDPLVWKVAFDGLSVVVHHDNDWVDCLTVEELGHIWRADDPAQRWSEVREGFPDREIKLFGPDSDSGTYEYFNEVILHGETPRSDHQASSNDNDLVTGVSREPDAIGHFGFAYYQENTDVLKIVPVDGGEGCVEPTFATIGDGSYAPLSRPIFMVTDGAPKPGTPLHAYFTYAMGEGQELIRDVGYVALDPDTLEAQRAWL